MDAFLPQSKAVLGLEMAPREQWMTKVLTRLGLIVNCDLGKSLLIPRAHFHIPKIGGCLESFLSSPTRAAMGSGLAVASPIVSTRLHSVGIRHTFVD